jgi:hypothetical protein
MRARVLRRRWRDNPAYRHAGVTRRSWAPRGCSGSKLNHHGSRANVTQDLTRSVEAEHFLFSTNGAYFKHPNAEAVARVIVGGKEPTLWFNYDTPHTRQWAADGFTGKYGHAARYPRAAGVGIVVELPARRAR